MSDVWNGYLHLGLNHKTSLIVPWQSLVSSHKPMTIAAWSLSQWLVNVCLCAVVSATSRQCAGRRLPLSRLRLVSITAVRVLPYLLPRQTPSAEATAQASCSFAVRIMSLEYSFMSSLFYCIPKASHVFFVVHILVKYWPIFKFCH